MWIHEMGSTRKGGVWSVYVPLSASAVDWGRGMQLKCINQSEGVSSGGFLTE